MIIESIVRQRQQLDPFEERWGQMVEEIQSERTYFETLATNESRTDGEDPSWELSQSNPSVEDESSGNYEQEETRA